MASIIAAMDKHRPFQKGENGHQEFGWSSTDFQERILQLSFQVTRTQTPETLSDQLLQLLKEFRQNIHGTKDMVVLLSRMIGQTRDIVEGKGEYALAYMMIHVWHQVFPTIAKQAVETFFISPEGEEQWIPYGSWKDIKYLCQYCKDQDTNASSMYNPLILHCVQLVNRQLWMDSVKSPDEPVSLVAKWIPREGSKYGWLFNLLVQDYFPAYYEKAGNPESLKRAHIKAKMNYRKIVAKINRRLDTVQIKECANNWSAIDHSKTTSITMAKQRRAFLNLNKHGTQRSIKDDRIQCAENFKHYIEDSIRTGKEVKGKRMGMADFTKQALAATDPTEIDALNSQWRDNAKASQTLGNFIALVDVSGSMEGDPMNAAIALGIRVAEKSKLGKRVLTFETNPTWVNLEQCSTFTEMVNVVRHASWGGSTNLYAAFDRILEAIVQRGIPPQEVADMVFVIFSDMQIDECQSTPFQTMVPSIQRRYADAGIRAFGTPYIAPHLVFWNLRSTNGFPSLSSEPNVSMVSGFSPQLLNDFCEKGRDAFEKCTPWEQLVESLSKERYRPLEKIVLEYLA